MNRRAHESAGGAVGAFAALIATPGAAWRDRGVRSLAERVAEFHQRASGLEDQDEPATDPHEREDEHYAQEKGHTA